MFKLVSKRNCLLKRFIDFRDDIKSELQASRFRSTHSQIICIYIYVCVCMYVCMNVCMNVCMYACMYVRMYICMYVRIYIYIYIYFTHFKRQIRTMC